MSDYIVDSAELTAIADAIRTQARITGNLIFPSGFVSTINELVVPSTTKYQLICFGSDGKIADIVICDADHTYTENDKPIDIIKNVKNLRHGAIRNFTGTYTFRFMGTPDSISPTAFVNCTGTITIKVPWSEGAIPGAPWGATGATIQYNWSPNN